MVGNSATTLRQPGDNGNPTMLAFPSPAIIATLTPEQRAVIASAEIDSKQAAIAYDYVLKNGSIEDLLEVALIGQEADNHLGNLLRAAGFTLYKC